MTFGETIREARKKKQWSQRKLADEMTKAGATLDFTYLSRIENDIPEYPLSESKIRTLAGLLDLEAEELMVMTNKMPRDLMEKMRENPAEVIKMLRRFKK